MKKMLIAVLALLLVVGLASVFACGEAEETTTTAGPVTTSGPETTAGPVTTSGPETLPVHRPLSRERSKNSSLALTRS